MKKYCLSIAVFCILFTATGFTQQITENLVQNGGAETEMTEWTVTAGSCVIRSDYKFAGESCFALKGDFSNAFQRVNVSQYSQQIDTGNAEIILGAWIYTKQYCTAGIKLRFLDALDFELGVWEQRSLKSESQWLEFKYREIVPPPNTRSIEFNIMGDSNSYSTRPYFDELSMLFRIDSSSPVSTPTPLQPIPVPTVPTQSDALRGDVNQDGSITPADAQAAFELFMDVVGGTISANPPFSTGSELWLADFNQDGNVTPSDAQAIFEEYIRILSGKTTRKSTRAVSINPKSAESLTMDTVNATPGSTVTVPVHITGASEITSFSFALNYPTDQLEFVELDRSGTLTANYSTVSPIPGTGKVTVAGFAGSAPAISGDGVLILVKFKVKSTASAGLQEITPSNLIDGLAGATTAAGGIQVSGNTTPVQNTPTATPIAAQTPIPTPPPANTPTTFSLVMDTVSSPAGSTVSVPVRIYEAQTITSFSFNISFNTQALQFLQVKKAGTLTSGFSTLTGFQNSDGGITVAGFAGSGAAVTGSGLFVELEFQVQTGANGLLPITISNMIDGLKNAQATNGGIQIASGNVHFTITDSGYVPGGEARLYIQVDYEDTPRALGIVIDQLPSGWTYAKIEGDSVPVQPTAGSTAPLNLAWIQIPASPIQLQIVFNVPASESSIKTIGGYGTYRLEGPEIQSPFSHSIDQKYHSADTDKDYSISFNELMRIIQLFNSGGYHCADSPTATEDGYVPGPGNNHARAPHSSDYNPQDWKIDLNETLRAIQFYNLRGYLPDPSGEDGFVPVSSTNGKIARYNIKSVGTLQDSSVQATRVRTVGTSTVDITVTIVYDDTLTALGVQETLPDGWTFDSVISGNTAISPSAGASGSLDFAWIIIPSSPVTLTYRVNTNDGNPLATIDGTVSYRTTGAQETATIQETVSVSTPTPTIIPSTPVPASFTPTPTPLASNPTETPSSNGNGQVFIYDNSGDTSGDLIGQTDFDAVDNRNLTIAWTADQGNATDWHIYVRKGFGGAKFLGRTAAGNKTYFDWNTDAAYVDPDFANGPDFNAAYTFRIVRIDGNLSSDDFIDASAPVGFNLQGGNPVSLAIPELPQLNPGQIVIYDDILGGNDLAPMNSSGSDIDPPTSRAIQLAWNMDTDVTTVSEYHILVSVDGAPFTYLGQTYIGNINYFWWTPNQEFRTAATFAEGPQDGKTYQFKVILVPLSGNRKTLTTGTLNYSIVN